MDSAILAVVASLSGTFIGGVVTYATARRSSSSALQVARLQIESQDRRAKGELEAEKHASWAQVMADSYDEVAGWLAAIERTVERVWLGQFNEDGAELVRCMTIVDRWPFDTTTPPASAATLQWAWSEEVQSGIRTIERDSSAFTRALSGLYYERLTLDQMTEAVGESLARTRSSTELTSEQRGIARTEAWQARSSLLVDIDAVRQRIRTERRGF